MYGRFKRVISIFAAAAVSASFLPCAFAQGAATARNAVTAAQVDAARSNTCIVNYGYSSEFFEEHGESIPAENVYRRYVANPSGSEENCFIGADPKTDRASEVLEKALSYEIDPSWKEYDYEAVHYLGDTITRFNYVYLDVSLSSEEHFFFTSEDIAAVINENNLGTLEKVMFLQLYDSYLRDSSSNVILISTDTNDYVVSHIRYDTDWNLIHYLVTDNEAFIEYMQFKPEKAKEVGYNNLAVKTSSPFADTDDSAVELLSRLGIISGYEDGTFRPDNYVTRAEAAKMIACLGESANQHGSFASYDKEPNNWDSFDFADLPVGHWARGYVKFGTKFGWINGRDEVVGTTEVAGPSVAIDGKPVETNGKTINLYNFCPDDYVTEQEMAKLLVSAIDKYGDTMASAEGGYPDGYVSVAKRMGICESASSSPATRLTAAHMLKNALDAYVTPTNSDDSIEVFDEDENFKGSDNIYDKYLFYDLGWNYDIEEISLRVRLKGTIDGVARDKAVNFTVSEYSNSYLGEYNPGDKLVILTEYDDITNCVGRECTLYCRSIDGNICAVMSIPLS